jgi:hypothetical protein
MNGISSGGDMKNLKSLRIAVAVALSALGTGPAFAGPPRVVDGVAIEEDESSSLEVPTRSQNPTALTSSSIDFDTPALFSDILPLQLFQTLRSGAVFFGKGAVLDAASFEVTGASGTSILAFNGRTAVNGDGTIPQLPETILFIKPNGLGIARKQTVSLDVASKRDEGRTVRLRAFNLFLRVVGSDSVQLTPQMQTLTVSTATPEIVFVVLSGESELKVLAVDNFVHN